MLQKSRQAMGNRDAEYSLREIVEVDEGFFSTEKEDNQKDEKLKRERDSQKK